jgi:hypothetical protein
MFHVEHLASCGLTIAFARMHSLPDDMHTRPDDVAARRSQARRRTFHGLSGYLTTGCGRGAAPGLPGFARPKKWAHPARPSAVGPSLARQPRASADGCPGWAHLFPAAPGAREYAPAVLPQFLPAAERIRAGSVFTVQAFATFTLVRGHPGVAQETRIPQKFRGLFRFHFRCLRFFIAAELLAMGPL